MKCIQNNLASVSDLCNLHLFGFRYSFVNPQWTSLAAKLRVIAFIAPDCRERSKDLEALRLRVRRRPFGKWHGQSFFEILATAQEYLQKNGITCQRVFDLLSQHKGPSASFQRAAEKLILKSLQRPYYPEARLRQKMVRWKLIGVPGILERRVLKVCSLLQERCAPKVLAAYFRALWNGWVTDARFRSLIESTSGCIRCCALGCPDAPDSLDHYCLCPVFWSFVNCSDAHGLGLSTLTRSRNTFFLVADGLSPAQCIRLACGIYGLQRTIQALRHNQFSGCVRRLLHNFTKMA